MQERRARLWRCKRVGLHAKAGVLVEIDLACHLF